MDKILCFCRSFGQAIPYTGHCALKSKGVVKNNVRLPTDDKLLDKKAGGMG